MATTSANLPRKLRDWKSPGHCLLPEPNSTIWQRVQAKANYLSPEPGRSCSDSDACPGLLINTIINRRALSSFNASFTRGNGKHAPLSSGRESNLRRAQTNGEANNKLQNFRFLLYSEREREAAARAAAARKLTRKYYMICEVTLPNFYLGM